MQTANIMVSLGGDSGTTVPKYDVTVSEIAVLQAIHGNAAVHDIEPLEDVKRSHRDEIRRLNDIYGRAKIGDVTVMSTLFPGAASRAFEAFDELEIDESFFKPTERAAAPAPKTEKPKRGKKADAEEPVDDASDDVGDEPEDGKLFG